MMMVPSNNRREETKAATTMDKETRCRFVALSLGHDDDDDVEV